MININMVLVCEIDIYGSAPSIRLPGLCYPLYCQALNILCITFDIFNCSGASKQDEELLL